MFIVEDLITRSRQNVHCERLAFYDDSLLEVITELKEVVAATTEGYEVKAFMHIKEEDGEIKLLVDWLGFEEADRTHGS